MKTDQLITALVADRRPSSHRMQLELCLTFAAACALTALLFWPTIGVRADLSQALTTWRFDTKLLIAAAAVVAALRNATREFRPDVTGHGLRGMQVVTLVLLAIAVVAELATTAPATWGTRLLGTNALLCLVLVPLLALLPFAVGIWVMQHGAPRSPARAGMAVGQLAAAVAILLYAMHCFDDSPLFVAVWYSLAAALVTLAGAAIGRRVLTW